MIKHDVKALNWTFPRYHGTYLTRFHHGLPFIHPQHKSRPRRRPHGQHRLRRASAVHQRVGSRRTRQISQPHNKNHLPVCQEPQAAPATAGNELQSAAERGLGGV